MAVDSTAPETVAAVETPRGHYKASVDGKGRLKLPSTFQRYLSSFNDKSYFVTTTNETTVYIYPLSEWKKIEAWINRAATPEEFEQREALRFVSGYYGADAVMDGEGRLMIPQTLREKFEMVGAEVHLQCSNGFVEVINQAEYAAMQRAYFDKQKLAGANAAMRTMGNK